MSTVQSQTKLDDAARQAIIAAVASGQSKIKVAQQFGVHRNTVAAVCDAVQKYAHPGNPLSKDGVKARAYNAVLRGLDYDKDPIGSANVGVKVLSGIGEFVTGQRLDVQGSVAITFAWGPVQEPEHECIDVTARSVTDGNTSSE